MTKTTAHISLNVGQVLHSLATQLGQSEAQDILLHCLEKPNDFTFLITHATKALSLNQTELCNMIVQRRLKGEPLAYILGSCYFYDLPLKLDQHCLIPRPDTEVLVDTTRELIDCASAQTIKCLDLGTGPGSVILALKHQRPQIQAFGSDLCEKALSCANLNASFLQLKIQWICSSWCEAFKPETFHIIVSNPPYIATTETHLMNVETRFEPRHALFSKKNGLHDILLILKQGKKLLKEDGWLVIEHGFTQAQAVREAFKRENFSSVITRNDLQSNPRVTFGQLKKN